MFKITIDEITEQPATEQVWRQLNEKPGDYGYVPPAPGSLKTTRRTLLVQEKETLDVGAVIKAVNDL